MKIILSFFVLIYLISSEQSPAQAISKERADKFLEFSLFDKHNEEDFIDGEELRKSRRLGITYDETKIKYLIAYNIPDDIKPKVKSGEVKYRYNILPLENNFSKLELIIPDFDYKVDFYFRGDYLVSPSFYYSQGWKTTESRFFKFYISTPELFNAYSAERLDNFVLKMSTVLKYSENDLALLEKEKIFYYFCKDDFEIEKLSGFKTLGIYNLASDLIITTYNCHYHEICHLLMNFKINNVPLYTHPLLQEGFAVAYGGRGGREPEIMLDVGNFIINSEFIKIQDLLTKDDFLSEDASITYPAAGIISKYLVDNKGFDNYLSLYKKYSSGRENINKIRIDVKDLFKQEDFKNYSNKLFSDYSNSVTFQFDKIDEITKPSIISSEDSYLFFIKDHIKVFSNDIFPDYISKKYDELFKGKEYEGEKYLAVANENEISIYNLFSNNLIFNYAVSFSNTGAAIQKNKHGLFVVKVNKNIFNEDICNLLIKY